MMNIVAMWMLLSSLGAAMVMSPEPILVKPGEASHPLKAARDATKESVGYAAEAARKSGEGIRQSTGGFMDAVKDTSQAGLEKIGLASPSPERSTFEQWEMGLQAAKDKAAAAAAAGGTVDNGKLTTQEKLENLKKYGRLDSPSATELAREKYENLKKYEQGKAAGAYDATKEAAGSAASAVKDKAEQAGEGMKDAVVGAGEMVQDTYKTAEEAAAAAKDKLEDSAGRLKEGTKDTLGFGGEKTSEGTDSIEDMAEKIAQSVQDNVNAAGTKAYDTAGSAKDSTYETVGSAYEYAADALNEVGAKTSELLTGEMPEPSYKEKIKMATEQAADILRTRGKDAMNYMPNVGQGLSMGGAPDSGLEQKVNDYMEAAKDTAGDMYGSAKEVTGSGKMSDPNWREEFLNRVGIKEEADLSKFDVVVGNVFEYWKSRDFTGPGVFQKAGVALDTASARTKDAAKTVRDKMSTGVHCVGDHIRSTKDCVVNAAKHVTEKAADAVHETKDGLIDGARDAAGGQSHSDTLTRTWSKLNNTSSFGSEDGVDLTKGRQGPVSSLFRKIGYATAAWLVSSIKAAHLFAFSFTYGASLWVTFISGYLLARHVPRQLFGFLQSKMFPVYLRLMGVGQFACLTSYIMLHPWTHSTPAEKLQYVNLWTIMVSTLVNIFFLEPRATKMMFEKMKIEKEEESGLEETERNPTPGNRNKSTSNVPKGGTRTLDEPEKSHQKEVDYNLNVLHGWSSMFNLLGLLGETWHLWHISRSLGI